MLAPVFGVALAAFGPPELPPEPSAVPSDPSVPQPPIRWTAPPRCPDTAAVADRASRLLGRPIEPGEIELEGTVESTASGYTLRLRTAAGPGAQTQRLESERCEVLADTAALIAAVLVDPLAAVTTVERSREASRSPPPPVVRAPPEVAAPTAEEPVDRPVAAPPPSTERPQPRPGRLHGSARLMGGGEYGAVPGGTGGIEAALALGNDTLRGELLGSYWIGREVRRNDGRATVSLGYATPRFCGLIPAGPIRIPLCAGVELGAMRADASDVPAAQTRHGLWLAGHAAAGVRWSFRPRLSLWIEAQAFVPAVFPRFELVASDGSLRAEVYRPNPAGVRGVVGFEYKLF